MLQVPTDSIQKFLAIFGLALAIASVGFVYRELEKQREIEGYLARLEAEIEFQDKLAQHAIAQYEEDQKRLSEKVASGQALTAVEREQFVGAVDKLKLESEAYCRVAGESGPKIREQKVLQKYSAFYFFAAGVVFFMGASISVYGFRRWHTDSKRNRRK